jgi:pimeloyl-ACP methyl ester carboxylesterase
MNELSSRAPAIRFRPSRSHIATLRGVGRMAADATSGIAALVEAVHARIARTPTRMAGPIVGGAIKGITSLAYGSVRGVTRVVGNGLDAVLLQLERLLATPTVAAGEARPPPDRSREALLAALNGVLGDYLEATRNPLAIRMAFRKAGVTLPTEAAALAAAFPEGGSHIVVLLHGLCMSDLQWNREAIDGPGHDHGASLARDLGVTPLHLHYNSGRHVSVNGRELAALLDELVRAWPAPIGRITLLGHSMGGLVARSAVQRADEAGFGWRTKLASMVFLGTPHHGAPLERGGQWIDSLLRTTGYTAPFSRLGRVRSAGITDLRHGSVRDEDWRGRNRFAHGEDTRLPLPLPVGVRCHSIAATLGGAAGVNARLQRGELTLKDCAKLPGDGLVPVASALGQHVADRYTLGFAPKDCWLATSTSHLDLLSSRAVYAQLRGWVREVA